MVFLLVGLVVMSVSCKDAEETLRKAGVVENTVPVYKKREFGIRKSHANSFFINNVNI